MLTVLMATLNGARTLPEALSAYCQVQAPTGGWKLVIVDNGSTDATREIIHSFMDRLPLTYLFEPSGGKNAALNTGLASVEGDLVVLTDDDALPRFDWLKELRLAADSHPSFSVFGGQVIPRWENPPEKWILSKTHLTAGLFACTDPSWEEGPILSRSVYGPNMAIRRRIFETGYRFNPEIGPRGRWYAMGSELELNERLAKAGFSAWYCKQAVVEHMVRKFQMTRSWIFSKALKFGRGQYRIVFCHEDVNRKKYLGIPGYLIREVMATSLKVGCTKLLGKLLGGEAKLFERRWRLHYFLGQVIEAHLIHKELRSNSAVQGLKGSQTRSR
jgi:L-malate glycosyltransferase